MPKKGAVFRTEENADLNGCKGKEGGNDLRKGAKRFQCRVGRDLSFLGANEGRV